MRCSLIFPCLGRPNLSLNTENGLSLLHESFCATVPGLTEPLNCPFCFGCGDAIEVSFLLSSKPSNDFPILQSKSQSPSSEAFHDVAPVPSLSSFFTPLPLIHYIPAMPSCSPDTLLPQGLCTCSSLCLEHATIEGFTQISPPQQRLPWLPNLSFQPLFFLYPSRFKICLCPTFFPLHPWHYPTYFTHGSCLLSLPSRAAWWTQLGRKHMSLCEGYCVQWWLRLS